MRIASRTTTLRRRGFSAVEIIAVAAVISILALILIPNLTERVEDARKVAVDDEMGNMVKFISLAFAETGKYVRLQDFDNTSELALTEDEMHPEKEVPWYAFDNTALAFTQLTANQRDVLAKRWNGPYTQYLSEKKYVTIGDMKTDTYWVKMLTYGTNNGPIAVASTDEDADDRYPLDPWGNPYFYFPPETQWKTTLIFSMGPDGLPGSETAPDDTDYYPEERTRASANPGLLGTSDDIRWEF